MEHVIGKIPVILLTGLMAVAVAFAIGAFTVQEAHAAELGEGVLYVGGQDIVKEGGTVTGDNGQGTATLSYDGDDNPVLTLENYKCENGTGDSHNTYYAVIQNKGDAKLTIQMNGENAVKPADGQNVHYGIYSRGSLVMKGDGTLTATSISDLATYGIRSASDIRIESGNITATGGDINDRGESSGISAEGSVTIVGGTVEAFGGNKGTASYGILGRNGVEITGGVVTATSGNSPYSCGISGSTTIGKGITRVEVSGATKAFRSPVKNAVPGRGWDNAEGTGDAATILINKDGSSYNYKKAVFEPELDISITGKSSTVTYNGGQQSVSGFTVKYNVGDGNWIDEAPAGVSVKLKDGTAEAKGTYVKTYEMGLSADSFDISWGYAGSGNLTVTDGALTIEKAPLTIKAKDQTFTYNGKTQGEGDTVYEDPAEIAKKVTVEGLQGSDKLTKIDVFSQGKEVGEYPITLSGAAVGNATANYAITYVNGKLMITKAKPKPKPQPKPQPKINKAAAKIALDAGVVAKSSGSIVTASWGKVKGASSYVIYANYCDKKKCKKIKTVSGKTTSFDITKLNGKKFNPKKNLKFYVVAYKTVKGKKVKLAKSILAHAPGSKNSKRTNVTGVKVKKASFTLKKGKSAKIKAKLVLEKKNRKPLKHSAKFRYASSNKKVAKVSKKGKITAVGKGKCTVYVYAVSGVSKKIKVTVK